MKFRMTDDLARRMQQAIREKRRNEEAIADAEAPSTIHDAAIRIVEGQIELGELLVEAIVEDYSDEPDATDISAGAPSD